MLNHIRNTRDTLDFQWFAMWLKLTVHCHSAIGHVNWIIKGLIITENTTGTSEKYV